MSGRPRAGKQSIEKAFQGQCKRTINGTLPFFIRPANVYEVFLCVSCMKLWDKVSDELEIIFEF
jgi:hypothetical protein